MPVVAVMRATHSAFDFLATALPYVESALLSDANKVEIKNKGKRKNVIMNCFIAPA